MPPCRLMSVCSSQDGSTESIYEPPQSQTLNEVQPRYQRSPVPLRQKVEWGGSDPTINSVSLILVCLTQPLTSPAVDDGHGGSTFSFQTCGTQNLFWLNKDRMKASFTKPKSQRPIWNWCWWSWCSFTVHIWEQSQQSFNLDALFPFHIFKILNFLMLHNVDQINKPKKTNK